MDGGALPPGNLVSALIALETNRDRARSPVLLDTLIELLRAPDDEELTDAFSAWVRTMLAEKLCGIWTEQWVEQGRAQGIERGIEQDRAEERALLLAELAEQRGLPRAPLAVVLDATADVPVLDVVEHVAVPRLDQVVEAGAADELLHPRGSCESTDRLTQISSTPNTATCR